MGFLDKLFGKKHGEPVTTKALPARSVPGALVASDQNGTVLYNMLTPHMQQFMGKCVGAIKKVGIPAKGTAQFSILIGERRLELRLDSYYEPSDDPQLVDCVVEAAKKTYKLSLTMRWSEADYLSRIMLSHAPRQVAVSLILGVRQTEQ